MDDRSSETTFQAQQSSSISHSILSADLLEVPVIYEIQQHELERLKNRPQGNHQEALATILAQAAQLNSSGVPSSSTRSSLIRVTPTVNADRAEADKTETRGSKSLSASQSGKIPNDIYKWRQYGRIQLKTPKGSRSYHKCTSGGCNAKKIVSCYQSNSIPKVVYKGQHQHDAPKRVVSSGGRVILTRQSLKRKSISTHGLNADVEDVDHKDATGSKSLSASQSGKMPNDTYKWRQYGRIQLKTPEGSRSYHKCTSSGCNAKKIVSCYQSNFISKVVYKGQHQHDATKRVVSSEGGVILTRQSLKRKSISTHGLNADVEDVDHKDAMGSKSLSASHSGKIPNDNYSWRQYGRIQLKTPKGSRSYHKCTSSGCNAKKIVSCYQSNCIPKVVYKGEHRHDTPKRGLLRRGKMTHTPKSLKGKSNSSHGFKEHRAEHFDGSRQKQRVKKSSSAGSVPKQPKKPKFIVHTAADIEISADGYNWKSYGQMMVKGNVHRRNYYKCTSAGCTVKKHVDKVNDGSSQAIITYQGVHNHNVPASKRR